MYRVRHISLPIAQISLIITLTGSIFPYKLSCGLQPSVRELLQKAPPAHGAKSDFNIKATMVRTIVIATLYPIAPLFMGTPMLYADNPSPMLLAI